MNDKPKEISSALSKKNDDEKFEAKTKVKELVSQIEEKKDDIEKKDVKKSTFSTKKTLTGLISNKPLTKKMTKSILDTLDLTTFATLTLGRNENILCQPDIRYALMYIIYCTKQQFPTLIIDEVENSSVFLFIYLCLILLNTAVLYQDKIGHEEVTTAVNDFNNNSECIIHYEKLINVPVPKFMEPLICNLVSTNENLATNLKFIPSYSACTWIHDFGRLMPPQIFLTIHNQFAKLTRNMNKSDLLYDIFNKIIVRTTEHDYTVSNLIGGPYEEDNQVRLYPNWIFTRINLLIDGAYTSQLAKRKKYISYPTKPFDIEDLDESKFYQLMIDFQNPFNTKLSTMIRTLENIYRAYPDLKGKNILELNKLSTTNSITTHMISDVTLPTCHIKPTIAEELKRNPFVPRTSTQYAEDQGAYIAIADGVNTLPPRPAQFTRQNLYIVSTEDTENRYPRWTVFNDEIHIYGRELIYNPYSIPSELLSITIALGFRIESHEPVATMIPTVHPYESPQYTNSQYTNGAIPISKIMTPDHDTGLLYIIIPQREANTRGQRPAIYALHDMTRNTIPIATSDALPVTNYSNVRGVTLQPGHTNQNYGPNIYAWTDETDLEESTHIPEDRIQLWSSYRIIGNYGNHAGSILFLPTLRHIHGTHLPMMKSDPPDRKSVV